VKREDLRVGQRVADRWFLEWGVGVVERVLKTRVKIRFPSETRTYDLAHLQFLEAP
jgi:hypothetical protein